MLEVSEAVGEGLTVGRHRLVCLSGDAVSPRGRGRGRMAARGEEKCCEWDCDGNCEG